MKDYNNSGQVMKIQFNISPQREELTHKKQTKNQKYFNQKNIYVNKQNKNKKTSSQDNNSNTAQHLPGEGSKRDSQSCKYPPEAGKKEPSS